MSTEKMLRVLYAEDEPITRMLIQNILKKFADVVSVSNGQDAFSEFEKSDFDVVVTDLSMPKMSGFELISRIKEVSPEIPIIVTTAFREEYFGLEELAVIIEKPIDIEKLISSLDSCRS